MSSETQQERRKSVGLKKKLWLKISQIQQKISTQRFKRLSKYPEDKSKTSTLRHGTGKLQKAEDRKHLEISKKAMTPYLEGGNQVIQGRILCLFDMSPSFEYFLNFWHKKMFQTYFIFLSQLWNHAFFQGILTSFSGGGIQIGRFGCLMCSFLLAYHHFQGRQEIIYICKHLNFFPYLTICVCPCIYVCVYMYVLKIHTNRSNSSPTTQGSLQSSPSLCL